MKKAARSNFYAPEELKRFVTVLTDNMPFVNRNTPRGSYLLVIDPSTCEWMVRTQMGRVMSDAELLRLYPELEGDVVDLSEPLSTTTPVEDNVPTVTTTE